jgi:hypothetical protein
MKLFALVDDLSWEKSICTMFYASNNEEDVLEQQEVLEAAMGQAASCSASSRIP